MVNTLASSSTPAASSTNPLFHLEQPTTRLEPLGSPASASVLAASGIDTVQLHAQALNALARITRELLAPETDHDLVNSELARATEALATLRIVDAHFTH